MPISKAKRDNLAIHDDAEQGDSLGPAFDNYFASIPESEADNFLKRLKQTLELADTAKDHIDCMSRYFAMCSVLPDADFKKTSKFDRGSLRLRRCRLDAAGELLP
jgi:hypothetical protein